jgi:hypothetical protein
MSQNKGHIAKIKTWLHMSKKTNFPYLSGFLTIQDFDALYEQAEDTPYGKQVRITLFLETNDDGEITGCSGMISDDREYQKTNAAPPQKESTSETKKQPKVAKVKFNTRPNPEPTDDVVWE